MQDNAVYLDRLHPFSSPVTKSKSFPNRVSVACPFTLSIFCWVSTCQPTGDLHRELAHLAGRAVPALAGRSGCTALPLLKGSAENSAARPHDARGPRRFVHCKINCIERVCLPSRVASRPLSLSATAALRSLLRSFQPPRSLALLHSPPRQRHFTSRRHSRICAFLCCLLTLDNRFSRALSPAHVASSQKINQ